MKWNKKNIIFSLFKEQWNNIQKTKYLLFIFKKENEKYKKEQNIYYHFSKKKK